LENLREGVADNLIDEAGSTCGKVQFEVSFTDNMSRAVAGKARRVTEKLPTSKTSGARDKKHRYAAPSGVGVPEADLVVK
jgi:hypothetical protein